MEANKTQLKTEMKEVTQKIASLQKELELKKVGETELKKQFEAISEFSRIGRHPVLKTFINGRRRRWALVRA
ncbi:hypothetical protein V6Z11_D11G161000 [Gossypium hirsutum]